MGGQGAEDESNVFNYKILFCLALHYDSSNILTVPTRKWQDLSRLKQEEHIACQIAVIILKTSLT